MKLLSKFFSRVSTPGPVLDPKNPQVVALSKELRALHALPIASEKEREIWYSEAEKLRRKLYEEYKEVYDSLPQELEHYLVDADIRAKDAGYARHQEELLTGLLSQP